LSRRRATGSLTGGLALAITAIALSIMATSAHGASTRAEYVAQVDPLCQSSPVQVRQALRRHHLPTVLFLEDLRSGNRKAQLRIAKAFQVTIKLDRLVVEQIAGIASPPGDEATIAKWVADLRLYVANEGKAVRAIRANKSGRAYKLIVRALPPLIEDNGALKPFGFQHCTF
jgi:hypothetical protein